VTDFETVLALCASSVAFARTVSESECRPRSACLAFRVKSVVIVFVPAWARTRCAVPTSLGMSRWLASFLEMSSETSRSQGSPELSFVLTPLSNAPARVCPRGILTPRLGGSTSAPLVACSEQNHVPGEKVVELG
jgi:hypothetical protein